MSLQSSSGIYRSQLSTFSLDPIWLPGSCNKPVQCMLLSISIHHI